MTRLPFSFSRTGNIAWLTLQEAMRQKLLLFFVLLAFGLVLAAGGLREFNFGSPELKFVADLGDGAIAFFGAALAIVATTQLFFSELESRTALTLLAKAVWRAEFVVGKFLGIATLTAGFCLLLSLVLAAVIWSRETTLMREMPDAFAQGRSFNYTALFIGGWLQWLKLAMLSAGTLLIACFAQTQLFAAMTAFAGWIVCHVQGLQRGGSWLTRASAQTIAWIFPDFRSFTLEADDTISWPGLLRLTAYALGHVLVACLLAIYAFRRREI